ncbi:branched-subunit amino acid transport protein [Natronocella acetinitrilica]|uniref:Branched-subunit amino acid transport protein n=2 Tax=Natronocella acetinitrilica TaxID=414046 RepID=A0AAE3KCL4_9GAMM|nr:branched-subunit amino acid transport protein [Natronocella acetinitrilica]
MSMPLVWTLVVVIGVVTFALRLSGILVLGSREMPPLLERALRYVPAAVLAAIVVPAIIHGGPDQGFHAGNSRLFAGLLAAVVAWTTRSVLATLGVGMGSLWLLDWLID